MRRKNTPNVIVFLTDQQRFDTTGIHGNPMNITPNFDRMAAEGADIHYSFTCQPICSPARSCLQTSRYATETGVFKNGISLARDDETLAKVFSRAGYRTAYFGKWHLAADTDGPVQEEDRGGYQDWLAANILEFNSNEYSTTMFDSQNQPHELYGYRADAVADSAMEYIKSHRNEPFFLFLSLIEPHHQNDRDNYPAPEGYADQYNDPWLPADLKVLLGNQHQSLAGYYGMVKRIDEVLGRLRDLLKSTELDKETILLFTSDHGCHFKTRNSEYKRSPHDSSLRVPSAVCGPGFWGRGRINRLVNIVDIAPTLIEACGLEVPASMQGESFYQADDCRLYEPEMGDDIFFQLSEVECGRGVRTRRWKYAVVNRNVDPFEVAGADEYREEYLYDLYADPHELTNIISLPQYAELRRKLKTRLLQRIRDIEGLEPHIVTIESDSVDAGNSQMWGAGQRKVYPDEIDL